MRRRDFISLIGGAVAWPLAARAQQSGGIPKVGLLYPGPAAFAQRRATNVRDGLRDAGFVGPDQVMLLVRASGGDPAKLSPLIDDLVANKVDVLLVVGAGAVQAVRSAAISLPIVALSLENDPIESGWIESYPKPGGNITGIFSEFPDFSKKWLELLKEVIPGLTHLVALWDPTTLALQSKAIVAAARELNVKIDVIEVRTPDQLDTAFDAVSARHPDGLVILGSPLFGTRAKQVAELTIKHRLPSAAIISDMSRAGALLSYGPNVDELYREQGVMTGKILHGSKPADLPAERPARFELIVNAKTAKELNLTIPTSVLLRADEVIE